MQQNPQREQQCTCRHYTLKSNQETCPLNPKPYTHNTQVNLNKEKLGEP